MHVDGPVLKKTQLHTKVTTNLKHFDRWLDAFSLRLHFEDSDEFQKISCACLHRFHYLNSVCYMTGEVVLCGFCPSLFVSPPLLLLSPGAGFLLST